MQNSVSDVWLETLLKQHADNVALSVVFERGGYVANLVLIEPEREGGKVEWFVEWSAAHPETPQPTIEAAVQQLRDYLEGVREQFFLHETAFQFANLHELKQPPSHAELRDVARYVKCTQVVDIQDWTALIYNLLERREAGLGKSCEAILESVVAMTK